MAGNLRKWNPNGYGGVPQEQFDERNKKIAAAHQAGVSRSALAEQFGITPQRVSQIVAKFASGVSDDDARAVERALLEGVRDKLLKDVVFGRPPARVTPTGQTVYDEDGNPVPDFKDMITAADVARKISESIRKADALDLPRRKQVEEDVAMLRVKEYLASLPKADVVVGEEGEDPLPPIMQHLEKRAEDPPPAP